MTANASSLFVQQYSGNYQLLLQRMDSRFRPFVNSGSHVGSAASPIDQIGAVEMTPVITRFGTKTRVDAGVDRRWVYPESYDLSTMFDTFDKVKLLGDPQSVTLRNNVAASNRQMDRVIATAIFADAKTGVSGGTTTSFGSTTTANGGQNVAVNTGGTASGLNVVKLREVRRQAMANEIDLDSEQLECWVTSKQANDLLAEAQIISLDFNERPVMVDGKVTRFMGINFHHYENLPAPTGGDDQSGTSRAIPVFVKSGMYLGMWNETQPSVNQRLDIQGNPWELYHYLTIGATRVEEKRVFRIWCRES